MKQSPRISPAIESPEEVSAATTETDPVRDELVEQQSLNRRLAADFAHFKMRTLLEGGARAAAQKEAFIHELLPVIDNLERALASGASAVSPHIHQGVEMTLEQMRRLLRDHGVEAEDSLGQLFDPRRHEAVSQRHDPARAEHAILEIFQRGYRQGGKVFRPAKVAVNIRAHLNHARHAR